jgi:PAS domain S-box-containing protein
MPELDVRSSAVELLPSWANGPFECYPLQVVVEAGAHDRERLVADLARSEARYRRIVEQAREGIWTVDGAGTVSFVNRRMAEMLEHAMDELTGRPCLDFVHEDDRTLAALGFEASRRGEATSFELRFRTKRGAAVWMLAAITPLTSETGELEGALGMVTDISDRKRMEAERQKLVALVESTNEFVAVTDLDGAVTYLNEAGRKLVGVGTPHDARRMRIVDFCTDDEAKRVHGIELPITLATGRWVGEGQLRHLKSGELLDVLGTTVLLRDPDTRAPIGYATVRRNVTEHKRLSRLVEEQRSRLEAVLDHMPSGVLILEPDGVVAYANFQAETILGSPVDLRALTITTLEGTPTQMPEFLVQRAKAGDTMRGVEHAVQREDGERCVIRSSVVPVRNADGELVSAVCVIDDVTDERAATEERVRDQRFREMFVGMLGHDLRQPLSAVVTGTALTLKRDSDMASSQRRTLERVLSAGQRMARMIEQLLDLTRARLAGGIPVYPQPADLRAIVRRVTDELRAAHPERAIDVAFEGRTEGAWDPDRLEQVVQNLLGNALAHGDKEHVVSMRIEDHVDDVRIVVHNHGAPIAAKVVPVLFDPFRQGSKAKKGGGLGLGLFITREVVRAHGGDVTVSSSESDGTTFTVRIPFVRSPPPDASSRRL